MRLEWWLIAFLVAAAVVVASFFRLRPAAALPLADASVLEGAGRRGRRARLGLVGLIVGLVVSAAAVAARPVDALPDFVSEGESTIVVLDVSSSVGDEVFRELANTLRGVVDAAGSGERIGLVLFSDVALEALPPGTKAAELAPFIRYFQPLVERGLRPRPAQYRAGGPGAPAQTVYPINPWFGRFSGGTRISTGLAAAREALDREAGGAGHVLLVSDLDEAEEDRASLASELVTYAGRREIELRVIALPPATEAEMDAFRRALGDRDLVVASSSLERRGRTGQAIGVGIPIALVALVVALGAAFAVYLLVALPMEWRLAFGKETAS